MTPLTKVRFIFLLVMLALVAFFLAKYQFHFTGGSDGSQFN